MADVGISAEAVERRIRELQEAGFDNAAATLRALLSERDAATARAEAAERERDEFRTRSIAMHRRVSQLESGATYRWLGELREQFRKERNTAAAERDRLREALEKAAIAAEVESAGHAIAIIEAALTSAKEPSA